MSTLKRLAALCLCLLLLVGLCPREVFAAPSFPGVKGPTLVKQSGTWYYVKNGSVCYDTTLVKYSGSWYYVKNGTTQPGMTTLVKYNGSWWYVVNGRVASKTTSLVKYNNEWWYVVNGKVASSTTSLVKYNNEWWYVVKGKVASNTTSLVKYNNEWWYVVKGKVAARTTTLVKYNGGWYYIVKGKLAARTTTLVKYNGTWYYVEQGKVNFSDERIFFYGNRWYYIKNGTTHPALTTLITYNDLLFYVENGILSDKTTFVSYNAKTYYVELGVAATGLTGFVALDGKEYYVENGIRKAAITGSNIWKYLPDDFFFSSGAGGWGTELIVKDDGSFTGTFHDSNLGETGAAHPYGTTYICAFRGKFTTPRRVDDYTYKMRLSWMSLDRAPDQVYYEDGIKYITAEPYGMEDAEDFYIYLPGTPIEDLSEDFLMWAHLYGYEGDYIPEGVYGIYNDNYGSAFMYIEDWSVLY